MSESKIQSFFQNKSVFLTGAGGFLGKLILEKLIRSCQIDKVYILLRSKNNLSGQQRLKIILKSKVFDLIKTTYPELLQKIVVVEGDLTKPALGMNNDEADSIRREVSIVIHSAATISFSEPLAKIIRTNVEGTKNVMEFCIGMVDLKAVVYVSTAYSNSDLDGEIEEKIYPLNLDPNVAIFLAHNLRYDQMATLTPILVGKKPSSYAYTKHLAENLVDSYKTILPVCIVRPSLIMSTELEPFPGWISGINFFTAYLLGIYTGLIHSVYFSLKYPDLIPADHVVNAILAASWKTSLLPRENKDIAIYNIVSGTENPIFSIKLRQYLHEAANKFPSGCALWVVNFARTFTNKRITFWLKHIIFHKCPCYVLGKLSQKDSKFVKLHSNLEKAWPLNRVFFTKTFYFSVTQKNQLLESLTEKDLELFGFDVRTLCWSNFIQNYIKGIRKYILKEEDSTFSTALKNQRRLKIFQSIICIIFYIFLAMWLAQVLSSESCNYLQMYAYAG